MWMRKEDRSMRQRQIAAVIASVVILLAQAPRTVTAQTADGGTDIDTSAVSALQRMSTYLRSLKTFQLQAVATREYVLLDGQKVQFGNSVQLLAERPNRLRVEFTSDRQQRLF